MQIIPLPLRPQQALLHLLHSPILIMPSTHTPPELSSLTANPCPAHPSASPSTYTDTRSIASRMRQAAWGSSKNPPGRPGISSSFPPPLPSHLLQLSFALRLQRHDSTIPYLAHISEGPASKSPERRSRGGAARASKKRLADQGSSYDARMMTVCMNGRAMLNREARHSRRHRRSPEPRAHQ